MGTDTYVELPRKKVRPNAFVVEAFDSVGDSAIDRSSKALGFRVLSSDAMARVIKLTGDGTVKQQRDKVRALSAVHGVRFIRKRSLARINNIVATALMGNADSATHPNGL